MILHLSLTVCFLGIFKQYASLKDLYLPRFKKTTSILQYCQAKHSFFTGQMLPLNDDDPGHFPRQYHIVKRSGLSLPYLNLRRHNSFKIQEGIAIFNDSLF